MHQSGQSFLDIDCSDLRSHDNELYLQLVHYPQEVITIFDMALAECYNATFDDRPEIPLQVCSTLPC